MTYGVYSLPTTFFIDAQGHAVVQASGAIDAATLQKGIDMISIAQSTIVVQVSKNFTPAKAEELCKRLGHTNDVKAATKEGLNYMIFPRY